MKDENSAPQPDSGRDLKAGLERLAIKYELDLLVLLGSYGTKHFLPERSDLDIAFLSRKQLQPDQYLRLMADLGLLFQHGRLDLIDLRKASPLLKFEIADKGRLLFHSGAVVVPSFDGRPGLFAAYRSNF